MILKYFRTLSATFYRIILLFTICLSVTLQAQLFPMRTYSIDDGLNTNVVNDAVQVQSGKIWFATELGVSIYDGSTWFNFPEQSGLPKADYIKIHQDIDKNIWILPFSLFDNIYFYKNSEWKAIPRIINQNKKERFTSFSTLKIGNDLVLLAGTTAGLFRFQKNKWEKLSSVDNLLDCDIFSLKSFGDKFYIASRNGLFTLDEKNKIANLNKFLPVDVKEILALDISKSPRLKYRDQNVCWILTKSKIGYINLGSNEFTMIREYVELKTLPRNKFFFIKYDGIHRIFYGNELYKFYDDMRYNQTVRLRMNNGFSTTGNSNIMIDRENNLWFMSTRGVDKITNLFFTNYNRSTGFQEDEVASIEEISPGKLFLGQNYGFTILENNSQKYYSIENRIPENNSNCRLIDAKKDNEGNVWFAAGYLGIGKLSPQGTVTWFNTEKPMQFGAIGIDKQNRKIFGSDAGLFTFENGALKQFSIQPKETGFMRKIYIAENGDIYATGITSLVRFNKNGTLLNILTDAPRKSSFFGITKYKDDLLVGKPDGLFMLKNNHFEEYPLGKTFIKKKIFFVENDKSGNLWLGTDDGIIRWDGKTIRLFSKENGLLGRETNRSGFCVDSFGRIWIGTERGLSCYLHEYDLHESPPSIIDVHLTDFNRNQYKLDHEVNLAFNQNSFNLHFNAVSYINEEKIRTKIKLVGFENNWSEYTNRNSYRYTNLPAGSYYFLLQAQNINGEWSKVYRTATFTINPPFYQSWWFVFCLMLVITSFFIWVFKYVYQMKYSSELEIEVKSRTAELISSEQKIRSIVENAPYLIMMINDSFKITYQNKSQVPFLIQKSIGTNFVDHFSESKKNSIESRLKFLFESKTPIFFEHNFKEKLGIDHWLECYINPIVTDNIVSEAIAIIIDRTELKQAEVEKANIEKERKAAFEMLQKSLNEKEVLLKEVYHRVGNNLQVISSLLNLQAYYIDNKELVVLFQESLNRIKSMSMVHERLYHSANLDSIKMAEYISSLTTFLSEKYEVIDKVELLLDLDAAIIEVDRAIPLGLIINELLTNSFKYALKASSEMNQEQKVFISASKMGKNMQLVIQDNGPGLNKDLITLKNGMTLGMRLVHLLVTQLNGTVEYQYENGAKFIINFPSQEELNA